MTHAEIDEPRGTRTKSSHAKKILFRKKKNCIHIQKYGKWQTIEWKEIYSEVHHFEPATLERYYILYVLGAVVVLVRRVGTYTETNECIFLNVYMISFTEILGSTGGT